MIIPPYIKSGDTIGIVSPSGKIDEKTIYDAIQLLKDRGFNVVVGKNALNQHHQFAGTDFERASDLIEMVEDSTIKAILCSRGGYGCIRLSKFLKPTTFVKNPKWIIGFSDITFMHSMLNNLELASIHGVMTKHFFDETNVSKSFETLIEALSGKITDYQLPSHELNRNGACIGTLVGGNLSILYSLRGTPYDLNTDGKILFIEDLDEQFYHLDRMMMNLKIGGKLNNLSGLIVGSFTSMRDNSTPFGKSAYEIIMDAVCEYDFPVLFDFPAGHQQKNFALKLGCKAEVQIYDNHSSFIQK